MARNSADAVIETEVPAPAKSRVRDRIFETASALFYRRGIRAVGVDTIACEAGTNKMSFYRSFPSKDVLVAEYLGEQGREYWNWWDAVVAPFAGKPRKQVEALFASCVTKTCAKESRGCAIANATIEIPEDEHPGRKVLLDHKAETRRRLRKLAREMGAREPDVLGDALMLLLEGSYITRLTFSHGGPITAAAKAAKTLMDAHLRR